MDQPTQTATLADLIATLGEGQVLTGDAIDRRYFRDWVVPLTEGAPLAVVRPRSTSDVSAVLRICHARGVAVVPQGGLTGLAGGATPLPSCIVLSLERMNGIEEIDTAAATLTALAGTPLQAIQEAADKAGLFFPLDLGARGSCQAGGIVSTNAGGNRVIRYGMTRDLVLGLEVVLADGTVLTALNKLIKNNAAFDLKQLFVGSEGTLGVVTRVVFRLHPKPRSVCTALCTVSSFEAVIALLTHAKEALGGTLSAFEMMWADFYGVATNEVPGNPKPLPDGAFGYVLIESLGGDQETDQARFEAMLADAAERALIDDAVVANSASDARRFWQVRDSSGELRRALGPNLGFDIGLPIGRIGSYVEACRSALIARWPTARAVFFGHIGDSNLHLHAKAYDGEQPEHEIEEIVYNLVREWGGTVSAEHGIGLLKRPYLSYTRTPDEIATMRVLKQALDPKGILNPTKVIAE